MEKQFSIPDIDKKLIPALQFELDQKTKPVGSLGRLESIALQIGTIQGTLKPVLRHPTIVIFAADHGIANEKVSLYPQEVTYQMVLNFLHGGAAINVLARQSGIKLKIVDAGVNHTFDNHPTLINKKIGRGTKSFLSEPAMSHAQLWQALNAGGEIVEDLNKEGVNIIGFGEMGIANTSSSSLLISLITGVALHHCVGAGTGLDDHGIKNKLEILKSALQSHPHVDDIYDMLKTFGGFEIAMMCGAFLKAAALKMVIIVDGFIASAALAVAVKINPAVILYCIFSHKSGEKGHQVILDFFKAQPILDLHLRLGEGTGAALAYPIIESAVAILNHMASFTSAGVSTASK